MSNIIIKNNLIRTKRTIGGYCTNDTKRINEIKDVDLIDIKCKDQKTINTNYKYCFICMGINKENPFTEKDNFVKIKFPKWIIFDFFTGNSVTTFFEMIDEDIIIEVNKRSFQWSLTIKNLNKYEKDIDIEISD